MVFSIAGFKIYMAFKKILNCLAQGMKFTGAADLRNEYGARMSLIRREGGCFLNAAA